MARSEDESQVDVEIDFLREIAIAEGTAERAEHGVVVVACRTAQHRAMAEELAEGVGILRGCQPE